MQELLQTHTTARWGLLCTISAVYVEHKYLIELAQGGCAMHVASLPPGMMLVAISQIAHVGIS